MCIRDRYENGDSADPSFSASIGLSYQPSELWGMNFSAYRDMQTNPASSGGFTEVTALRLGYWHKIHQATLNLGLGYETNATESPDSVQSQPDLDFLTIDGSVSMPVFSNTCNATLFARYRNESGDPQFVEFHTGGIRHPSQFLKTCLQNQNHFTPILSAFPGNVVSNWLSCPKSAVRMLSTTGRECEAGT